LLGLYAAFAPPLLMILRSFNFVLDYSGSTTTGKTSMLRAIASVWGNPDERSRAAVLSTWNGTATWRERTPAVLNHMPFILDETKHSRHREEIAKTVYAVVQGQGRGRGTVQGIALQDFCQTVLFTSGEQPATSFTQDGGTRPRVLTLWGSPFGATTQAIGRQVARLNRRIAQNYGHAGPRFIQYLLRKRSKWKQYREWYRDWVCHFEDLAADNAIAGRMATHFALIAITSRIAHRALGFPWEWSDPIEPIWQELTSESGEADRAAAALRYVMSWAYGHQRDFFGRGREDQVPNGGWAGRWDQMDGVNPCVTEQESGWCWIGFIPHRLDQILIEGGFEPESVRRTWADRSWLIETHESNGTARKQIKQKIGKEAVWLVAIKRDAIRTAEGEEETA